MRSKLKYMLDIWMDAGFMVQLTLSTGDIIYGRLKETDLDEVILEPDVDGEPGPLTVVQLAHVMMATYVDEVEDEMNEMNDIDEMNEIDVADLTDDAAGDTDE